MACIARTSPSEFGPHHTTGWLGCTPRSAKTCARRLACLCSSWNVHVSSVPSGRSSMSATFVGSRAACTSNGANAGGLSTDGIFIYPPFVLRVAHCWNYLEARHVVDKDAAEAFVYGKQAHA